tara:strand:- start:641 stop:1042 length:402 start_codon:yes stop_codon:yes gene_type:complete
MLETIKIYKIVDNTNGNCYIGSTKQSICNRVARHKSYMKNENEYCSSCIVLKNNDYFYEQIDTCEHDKRKETEKYYINYTPNCINQRRLNFNKQAYNSQKIKCPCGCEVNRSSLKRHKESKKHFKYLEKFENN